MKTKRLLLPLAGLFALLVVFTSIAKEDKHTLAHSEYKVNPDEVAFDKMMSVLTHQRCMNCHPSDNTPKQGEDSHAHYFEIDRLNTKVTEKISERGQISLNDQKAVLNRESILGKISEEYDFNLIEMIERLNQPDVKKKALEIEGEVSEKPYFYRGTVDYGE